MRPDFSQQYRALWHTHWWFQSRTRFVMRLIKAVRQRQAIDCILDVGCGDGLMFDLLKPIGEVWGVEPDQSLISPDNADRQRIAVVPFDGQYTDACSYDLVLMLDVLEHIEDDAAAVERLFDLLSPGGVAIITVPALPLLWSRHDVVNHHFRRYTRQSLRSRLAEQPFKIEKLGYYFGWAVGPLLVRRMLFSGEPASTDEGEYQVHVPPRLINILFRGLSNVDHWLSHGGHMPVGSSLFAVIQKPTDH